MLRSRSCDVFFLVGLAALLVGPQTANAQGSRAEQPDNLVLRTYEVGDLTLSVEDRPYEDGTLTPPGFHRALGGGGGGGLGGGGGGFGGGGGAFSVPDDAPQPSLRLAQRGRRGGMGGMGMGVEGGGSSLDINDSQITLASIGHAIVTTIAPDTWRNEGGDGVITNVGSALVIAQTQAVHQQIEGLLGALRKGSNHRRTLRIDARWLLLGSDDLDNLLKGKGGEGGINRDYLAEFTRRPNSTRGITNCFSGQLVYLVSGTRKNVVSSYIPVVGSVTDPLQPAIQLAGQTSSPFHLASVRTSLDQNQPGVGYQPVITELNFGALLEIRPTLLKDDDSVVVDLRSTITVPGKGKAQGEGVMGPPHVDRIAIETQELATTLRMPLGEPFLVGGMTYAPEAPGADGGQATSNEKSQLYLVLELQ